MRSTNNRGTTKSGAAVSAPWLPDVAPPIAARGSKPRPDRLADIAHSKLEELIVTLELAPGSLWSEAMLSDRIGIGRTPVREAVQRLAWERLVTIIRRHGIRISDIDPHEQMLVVELRKEFEPLVASRAARRASIGRMPPGPMPRRGRTRQTYRGRRQSVPCGNRRHRRLRRIYAARSNRLRWRRHRM